MFTNKFARSKRTAPRAQLRVEALEDRWVPSGCQAFGAHVAELAQTPPFGFDNLGSVVSFIAQTGPQGASTQIAADHEEFCS
jgi:hypothetical protein